MTEDEAIARIRYRIDTATDIAGNGVDGKAYEDMEIAIKVLEEIQRYRAIGTVEECRETREKQKPMKPIHVYPMQALTGVRDSDDPGDYMCPACKTGTVFDAYGYKSDYCHYCGQKLDWSECNGFDKKDLADNEKMFCLNCNGCMNDTSGKERMEECVRCMRAYSDCYEPQSHGGR